MTVTVKVTASSATVEFIPLQGPASSRILNFEDPKPTSVCFKGEGEAILIVLVEFKFDASGPPQRQRQVAAPEQHVSRRLGG